MNQTETEFWNGKCIENLPENYILFVTASDYWNLRERIEAHSNSGLAKATELHESHILTERIELYDNCELHAIEKFIVPVCMKIKEESINGFLAKMYLVAEYGSLGWEIKMKLALRFGLYSDNYGEFIRLTNSTAREIIKFSEKNCTESQDKSGIRRYPGKLRNIIFRII